MKNNKKGLTQGITFALLFGIIAVLMVFTILFTKNFMNDVVTETSDQLQSVGNNIGIDSPTITAVGDLKVKFAGMDFKIDTVFLIAWIAVFLSSMGAAYFAPPLPTFNFFTMLIFGVMFLLFISNFLGQIMQYLLENLITNVFTAAETNLPVFNFYMENYYLIVVIWMGLLLFANQLSKALSTFESNLREEIVE